MSDTHVLLLGQSNALGFLNTATAPYTPTARVQIWADTNSDGVGDAWNYMNPGVNTGTLSNPTVWGPEVEFANQWLADNPTGYLWITKVTKGETGMAADANQLDWSPQSTGEMFDQAIAAAQASQANLNGSQYAFSNWDGVLVVQGETDATDATKAAAYEANWNAFKTALRNEVTASGPDTDLPIVYGRINDSTPYFETVRWAQYTADVDDPYAASFDTYTYTTQSDGVHYDAAAHVQLGAALYDAGDGWAW